MKYIVHRRLAEQIREGCESRLPVRINARWFSLGNVLPDFTHQRVLHLHESQSAGKMVSRMIARLCRWGVCGESVLPRWYSMRLGVLAHYVSDFMCYAHSPEFEGTFREHRAYEMEQLAFMEDFGFRSVCSFYDVREGEELAQSLRKAVAGREPGSFTPADDLDYAASMAAELVTAMVRICMERQAASWWNHLPVARRRYLSRAV